MTGPATTRRPAEGELTAAPPPRGRSPGPRIRMCGGCCCGTVRKHPDVDHAEIAAILAGESGPGSDLVRTDCLWQCDLSNVVVINPSPAARAAGARPVWVAHVNTEERAQAIADWVRRGGPGVADPPTTLGDLNSGPFTRDRSSGRG